MIVVTAKLCGRILVSILVLGLLLTSAYAEPLPQPVDATARTHRDAGNAAYDRGSAATEPAARRAAFQEAIREYTKGLSSETKFHYSFYWNLAQAHRQIGEFTRARYWYLKFIEAAPDRYADYKSAADDFVRGMKEEQEKAEAAKAAAALADTNAGGTPANAVPPTDSRGSGVLSIEPQADEPSAPRWYSDRSGWALVGGGVAGMLAGTGFLQNSSSLFDQAADEDRQSVKAELEESARTRRTIGAITGSVGLACLAVGVIKLSITDTPPPKSKSLQVTLGPSSLSIRGSF